MSENRENVRVQDDLYWFVNGETLDRLVIPEDRPTAGGFAELDVEVEKLMMADFETFAKGEKSAEIPEVAAAVELYKKVLDTERRSADGIAPLMPLLNRIRAITTVDELNAAAPDLALAGVPLPVDVGVETDMGDATIHSFVIKGPDTILPDTTYYEEGNEAAQQLLAVYSKLMDDKYLFHLHYAYIQVFLTLNTL